MEGATGSELFQRLSVALVIGLLIGIERGWASRGESGGRRTAGVRTFTLIGLLGGVAGVLAGEGGDLLLGLGLLALAALLIAGYALALREPGPRDYGVTTEVAGLLTFVLGALAARGEMALAAAAAVVTLAVLDFKVHLHGWVRSLERLELEAAIKLLLISVVLLPLLPDRGFGPGAALNPYRLWWMVVLVAGLSFVGYFSIKVAGARFGTLATGFLGGLASSTALTVGFSRLGRRSPALQPMLAAGVTLAGTVMFLRLLFLVGVVNAGLLAGLALPLGFMAAASLAGTFVLARLSPEEGPSPEVALRNPSEITMACAFGLLLAAVVVAAHWLSARAGVQGLYLLAAASGLVNVDAIALAMAHLAAGGSLAPAGAATAVIIAAFVNTVVKAGIVVALCGGAMAWRVAAVYTATAAAGLLAVFVA